MLRPQPLHAPFSLFHVVEMVEADYE